MTVVEIEAYKPDLMADWIAALHEMDNPGLDGKANYGTYPTLGGCLAAVKPVLRRHNLAIMQMVCAADDGQPDRLVTRVVHVSGSFIEDGGVPLYCENKNNPQKMGGAITYARRYGLLAMIGCVGDEDDDGIIATPFKELPSQQQTPEQKKVHEKLEPTPVPLTAEEIPFDESEAIEDHNAWVADAIAGFKKHKTMLMHNAWTKVNKPTLDFLETNKKDLYNKVLNAWKKKKENLTNE
tara:strand:- start:1074 stop:1787 length:714 start_codon:yes stop_codon:yes gene_type:complete